ncbi:hypothetical protein, partial [Enterobacter hormaechei]
QARSANRSGNFIKKYLGVVFPHPGPLPQGEGGEGSLSLWERVWVWAKIYAALRNLRVSSFWISTTKNNNPATPSLTNPVSYTQLTPPTTVSDCRYRWCAYP